MFKYPDEPDRDFIKRVIGLPGETVELQEQEGVHQWPAARRAVRALPRTAASDSQEVTSVRRARAVRTGDACPQEQYFVMGDNRDNSQDSRYWGFLPRDYVKGTRSDDLLVVRIRAGGLPGRRGGRDSVKRMVSVVTHFFTKTRWERLFHQIH